MKKTFSRKDYVKKYDEVFSTYIRLRDSDEKGIVTCPLCWAKKHRRDAQNMHFIPRWCYALRRSEENCHWWCLRCNVILHWNYLHYTLWMQNKFWIEKVNEMVKKKYEVNKISTAEIKEWIETTVEKIIHLILTKFRNQSEFYSLLNKYKSFIQ